MKKTVRLLVITCAFFLSACMPLKSSQPAPVIYALNAPPARGQEKKETVIYVVSIPEPQVPPGFDTNKIALYLYNKQRLDYYKNAVWPDRLGRVLQGVIIQSASSVPGMMIVAPESRIPAAYEMLVNINDFEPVYAAGPQAPPQLKVSISFQLVSLENRKVLFNATFSARSMATENTRTAIVTGLELLLRQVDARAFKKIGSVL